MGFLSKSQQEMFAEVLSARRDQTRKHLLHSVSHISSSHLRDFDWQLRVSDGRSLLVLLLRKNPGLVYFSSRTDQQSVADQMCFFVSPDHPFNLWRKPTQCAFLSFIGDATCSEFLAPSRGGILRIDPCCNESLIFIPFAVFRLKRGKSPSRDAMSWLLNSCSCRYRMREERRWGS